MSPAATKRPVSLRANVAWALAGNVVNAGCQWFLLVLVARLTNQESVGRFALASALTTPVLLATGLQLRGALATDARGMFRFADYLGVCLGGALTALMVTAGIAAAADYGRETFLVVMAVSLSRAIDSVADIHYGVLQQHERMRPIARSLMARGALNIAVVGAVLLLGHGIALAVLAYALSSAAVLFGYDVRVAAPILRDSGESRLPRFLGCVALRIIKVTLPLGIASFAVSLRTYIPRYFIEHLFGPAELGVFAALSSFLAAGALIVTALGQSAIPRLAQHAFRGESREFRRLMVKLVAIALLVGVAGIGAASIAGASVLHHVFGAAYAQRSRVLIGIMAVGPVAFASSILGFAMTATRCFMSELWLYAGTAIVSAIACSLALPQLGLVGAAAALGAASLLELIVAGCVVESALQRSKSLCVAV